MPKRTHGTTVGRWITAAGVALTALATSGPAWADAVPPPPANCPAGSQGDSCHGGEYCRPDRCTDDTGCTGNDTCRELQLCAGRVDCAGGWNPDAGPSYQDTVEGSCADGASCTSGTCETVRVCAPPGGTGSGAASPDGSQVVDDGCGCRQARPLPLGRPLSAISLAAVGLLLARRRRRG